MGLRQLPERTAHRLAILASLAACVFPWSFDAAAQSLYCCQTTQGKKACGDRLPDQCIGRPYTIRGPGGKIQRVEGMLSPEQRAAKEAADRQRKAEEEARAEQRRVDRALLATYANEADIDRARDRAATDLQVSIRQAEEKIAAAEKRLAKYAREAEFYKGKELPDDLRRGKQDAEFEIRAQRELIASKRKDLDAVQSRFAEEKRRYSELKNAQSRR